MFAAKDTLLTRPSGGYQISRSVRLRSSASGYFDRTFAAAPTVRTKQTLSAWLKRGSLGASQGILSGYDGTSASRSVLYFSSTDQLAYDNGGAAAVLLASTAVYRDPSAWYHILLSIDTTQATASNRVLLYVNGVQLTSFASANYPALNATTQLALNNANNFIGRLAASNWHFDGYLTEINFIDGQALTPASFGETDTLTGVWKPKRYTGTYGTNGFYLNFSDNSNNTATTIGKDYSGNGNNFTPSAGISVTAGVTYDSMLDVPTPYADGGNGRGNYCTLNPLDSAAPSLVTNGNLQITANSDACGTMSFPNGKWYFEVTRTDANASNLFHYGLLDAVHTAANRSTSSFTKGILYRGDGVILRAGSTLASGLAAVTQNKVLGVAFDMDAKTVQFYVDNVAQSTAQTITDTDVMPWTLTSTNSASAFNAGQRPFAYTPPSGFKALNTQNLPTPTISNGASYVAATTYTGTGSALTIANTVGSASFQPDLVWVKGRSGATDHALYDAVRGVQKQLESNSTGAETTETTGLTAFGSTGFTVGALAQMNTSAATYVGWQWNAGGSTVTNTNGSISAQVRANATAGFSIVTYTGTGANATVGHGLGVAPSMVIVKSRGSTTDWGVYHTSLGATKYIKLNTTGASGTLSSFWNDTAPTSSVFSIGSPNGDVNSSSVNYVAYCFAQIAGYSAFGSYTGNGSADGPFVFLGFRPRWVMWKRTDVADNWNLMDTARNAFNLTNSPLYPNLSNAEGSGNGIDILSNGFKVRDSGTPLNASGGTYIFAAFSEVGFKYALGR